RTGGADWLGRAVPDEALRESVNRELRAALEKADTRAGNSIVRALATWRTPDTAAFLAGLLQAPRPELHFVCLNELARLKDPATAPALATHLANPSETLRNAAVRALEEIGPPPDSAPPGQL